MLTKALFSVDNCEKIAHLFFDAMNVRVSKGTITKELHEHPDYPSLLSLSDVLSNYGVQTLAFTMDMTRFSELPVPFITVIKDHEENTDLFTIVRSVKDNNITYYNTNANRWVTAGYNKFKEIFISGIVLIADKENAIDENEYARNKWKDVQNSISTVSAFYSIPVLVIGASFFLLFQTGSQAVLPVLFALVTLAGAIVCSLLLWYEVDKHNPILQKICTGGKKMNCSAILSSRHSTILGKSWSVIGFVYFAGSILLILFTSILNSSIQSFLAWFNIMALPYTIFSIFYQWRVARQWCLLCLMVQFVLVAQFIIAFFAGWHVALNFTGIPVIGIAVAYLLPFLIANLLLPEYKAAKDGKQHRSVLQKLKHTPGVLDALLLQQPAVHESTEGLGIVLGSPHARHKIIKVCNPYCAPCAKAHKPLEELLNNNPDVQLRIVFLANNNEIDHTRWPAKHLLAIAAMNNPDYTKRALDDWYLPEEKDYDVFSAKYPLNGELKQQEPKIDAMSYWCTSMRVNFTPTFFVNGYQLPPQYDATDLKYFLSV